VDDFIVTGDTRQRVLDTVTDIGRIYGSDGDRPVYVGDYLYSDHGRFTTGLVS
jgi:hypothetical protein